MPFAQNILFPVDFSASSNALIPAVAAMARRLHIPINLLSAVEALADLVVAETALIASIERRANEKLAGFGADAFAGLSVRRAVVPGPAAHAIVEHAASLVQPIIIMPTHGENAFRRLLLGSVTASVLHDAECPIWTSAHCADDGPIPTDYRSIVCSVDLGPHTVPVLRFAKKFAADFGASVHVVHSIPGVDQRFENATSRRAHTFLLSSAKDSYPALAKEAEVDFPPLEILEGTGLPEKIAAAVESHHADLLIIGRGSVQGVLGRLRTNAHELIRQSRCPVLSV
jgi:nucleotide-binding universal stress UspA family protein